MAQPHHMKKDTTLTKLFVGGLPYHSTSESLHSYFGQFGEIQEAVVINDRITMKSKGYGFVTMVEPEAADRACEEPNPIIDGRKANVNLAFKGAKPRMQPTAEDHQTMAYLGYPGITHATAAYNPATAVRGHMIAASPAHAQLMYPHHQHPATHATYLAATPHSQPSQSPVPGVTANHYQGSNSPTTSGLVPAASMLPGGISHPNGFMQGSTSLLPGTTGLDVYNTANYMASLAAAGYMTPAASPYAGYSLGSMLPQQSATLMGMVDQGMVPCTGLGLQAQGFAPHPIGAQRMGYHQKFTSQGTGVATGAQEEKEKVESVHGKEGQAVSDFSYFQGANLIE